MKFNIAFFLLNVTAVIGCFIWQHRHGVWDEIANTFAVASLLWGLATIIQEYAADLRLRRAWKDAEIAWRKVCEMEEALREMTEGAQSRKNPGETKP